VTRYFGFCAESPQGSSAAGNVRIDQCLSRYKTNVLCWSANCDDPLATGRRVDEQWHYNALHIRTRLRYAFEGEHSAIGFDQAASISVSGNSQSFHLMFNQNAARSIETIADAVLQQRGGQVDQAMGASSECVLGPRG
jgi:hypothetical protein